ncbi:hypothetical protein PPL_07658 [Heterostelium album PN500]|uniref:Uncharacterized protein n=1 Tax=Heterostelium pallidum (strain ATCC 26659 / Pp 5 / PN500) TaxID=670386 RepID=D3BGK6_HETP5|nr:hypothetical protein PPL_07658 [Heterostelium album PN500]EFA79240.1 hypothetical protein PPL_07658 [Heterostelium album PN500]|eukprot:XP_020431361.1 hypothetical protein PPL_07658 [Heterostelium album PN500]
MSDNNNNNNNGESSRTSMVEPLIIRLLLTSDLPRKRSNSYEFAGRTYIGYSELAFNLAKVCKRWFKLVSCSINSVDIVQFVTNNDNTDLSALLMMIRGEQTTKQKFPIVNKLQSLTIRGGNQANITRELIETLVDEQKEGKLDGITSSIEHVFAFTFGMGDIPSDFYDMLENCQSVFPSLDSLSLYRDDRQEEAGSPLYLFLVDLPCFNYIKYLNCQIQRDTEDDNEESSSELLTALSKNPFLKFLDLTMKEGMSIGRLVYYFASWSTLEYIKIQCYTGVGDMTQEGLDALYMVMRENNKLKDVNFGNLGLDEMSLDTKDGIQQALAANKCIINLDVNYSLFYTKTKSTNIISQTVQQFKLVHKSFQEFNDQCKYETVTDSILEIISGNTHPNLTNMHITFVVGGEELDQFKQRVVDALSTNTTLRSFSYNTFCGGTISPSTALRFPTS